MKQRRRGSVRGDLGGSEEVRACVEKQLNLEELLAGEEQRTSRESCLIVH